MYMYSISQTVIAQAYLYITPNIIHTYMMTYIHSSYIIAYIIHHAYIHHTYNHRYICTSLLTSYIHHIFICLLVKYMYGKVHIGCQFVEYGFTILTFGHHFRTGSRKLLRIFTQRLSLKEAFSRHLTSTQYFKNNWLSPVQRTFQFNQQRCSNLNELTIVTRG